VVSAGEDRQRCSCAAPNQLTALLKRHIIGAVALLEAAKAGDQDLIRAAHGEWYAKRDQIADFLHEANPPQQVTQGDAPNDAGQVDQTISDAIELLRGFTYGSLEPEDAVKVECRLLWLERDAKGYAPQAYEQLVASYRRAGDEEAARQVAIEKQRCRRGELAAPAKAWSLFLDGSMGYGYRGWLAGVWLLVLVALGWIAFDPAYPEHFRAAKGNAGTPDFQPLLYTLDLVLPVVNLDQRDAWIAEGPRQWEVLLTVAGWVLASVLLAVSSAC